MPEPEKQLEEQPASEQPGATRVVLVRHAVTAETGKLLTGRNAGVDLTEEGRAQAKAAAALLADLPVAAVYASPMERTVQTAEILAEPHGLPVQAAPGLLEVDYGEWSGQALQDLAKTDLWKTVQAAPSRAAFPAGEGMHAMAARAVQAVEELVTAHPGELVVAVSHADVIKAVAAHYLGTHLDLFQRIIISPASATGLAFLPGYPAAVVCVNETGSLSALGGKADE
jgi:probable phosphoglycerate mutase